MGYELTFKVELTGVEGTYLQGMVCEVEVNELCDDQSEPEGYDVSMTSMLDTNQGSEAKEVLGYDDELSAFLKVIHKCLK